MSRTYTKWKCGICNQQIAWDELFTYTSNKQVVHFTCFKDKALSTSKIEKDRLNIILESFQEELQSIVNYKQRLNKLQDEETKKVLEQAEKDAEKNAAMLTRLIEKFTGVLS
jgi:hypothetical protein